MLNEPSSHYRGTTGVTEGVHQVPDIRALPQLDMMQDVLDEYETSNDDNTT